MSPVFCRMFRLSIIGYILELMAHRDTAFGILKPVEFSASLSGAAQRGRGQNESEAENRPVSGNIQRKRPFPSMKRSLRPRNGFTLLELLISLGLFIVLLGILWNIVSIFSRSQSSGTRLAERSQLVRSLAQILEDDLRAAIQDPIHPHQGPYTGEDLVRRFGLSGSPTALRIDAIEINPFVETEPQQPRLAMFGEVSASAPRAAELKTIFYEFRQTAFGGNTAPGLSRREIDFETPDINAPGPEGSSMVAPEVVDCRFRYFNGTAWSDSWESLDRDGLPVAIEATLKLMPVSEAAQVRSQGEIVDLEQSVSQLGLPRPTVSRIVVYLPTSPVRKFETYQRAQPPKKDDPLKMDVPPPPPSPPPSPLDPPPTPPTLPAAPQQSWIRG